MGGKGSGRLPWRPVKLTAELAAEIIRLIQAGNYMDTAASACGIHRDTFRLWMREGSSQVTGLKRDFFCGVKKAEAFAEANAVVRIRAHGDKAWVADAWFLERKYPQHWARKERQPEDGSAIARQAAQIAREDLQAALGLTDDDDDIETEGTPET